MTNDDKTPIPIDCGQVTDLETLPEVGQSAIDMTERTVRMAAQNMGMMDCPPQPAVVCLIS